MSTENLKLHLHTVECEANNALTQAQEDTLSMKAVARHVEEQAYVHDLRLRGEADEQIVALRQELVVCIALECTAFVIKLALECTTHLRHQEAVLREEIASKMHQFLQHSEVRQKESEYGFENNRNDVLDKIT